MSKTITNKEIMEGVKDFLAPSEPFITEGKIIGGNFNREGAWLVLEIKREKNGETISDIKKAFINNEYCEKLGIVRTVNFLDCTTFEEYDALKDSEFNNYVGKDIKLLRKMNDDTNVIDTLDAKWNVA